MKFSRVEPKVEFIPVIMTIETEEELNLLYAIGCRDVSIPQAFRDSGISTWGLHDLQDKLCSLKKMGAKVVYREV